MTLVCFLYHIDIVSRITCQANLRIFKVQKPLVPMNNQTTMKLRVGMQHVPSYYDFLYSYNLAYAPSININWILLSNSNHYFYSWWITPTTQFSLLNIETYSRTKILPNIVWFSKEAKGHPLMFWITLYGEDKTLHVKAQHRSVCHN